MHNSTSHSSRGLGRGQGEGAKVGFNLLAAFDTVGREDLLPKMEAMGIRRKSIK
jgi:hypothetical protein